jgi:hypothetical protein
VGLCVCVCVCVCARARARACVFVCVSDPVGIAVAECEGVATHNKMTFHAKKELLVMSSIGGANRTCTLQKKDPLCAGPLLMADEFFLPNNRLEVGDEIARGSFGAVSEAKVYGMVVCAKVRRGATVLLRRRVLCLR